MGESKRLLLRAPGVVLAAGAHDALSAKLAEEVGFDAIWASGFGISAVNALPDANILTMSETLDAVRRMSDAVRIPVIGDCYNGFGNAINVMRTVAEYERAGVAGICIEDNIFRNAAAFTRACGASWFPPRNTHGRFRRPRRRRVIRTSSSSRGPRRLSPA